MFVNRNIDTLMEDQIKNIIEREIDKAMADIRFKLNLQVLSFLNSNKRT